MADQTPIVCPTILAATKEEYSAQIDKVATFAHRLQLDLTDKIFASSPTIEPAEAWWPAGVKADFHLMYKSPNLAVETLLQHKPHMIIVHAETDGNFGNLARHIRNQGTKVGIALLQSTSAPTIIPSLGLIDHVLIFSGDLGNFGGKANLGLLSKIESLKKHKPELEFGWDGGVDDQNVAELVLGGVDVLNVGGFLQNAEDPAAAFATLQRIADETGTT